MREFAILIDVHISKSFAKSGEVVQKSFGSIFANFASFAIIIEIPHPGARATC